MTRLVDNGRIDPNFFGGYVGDGNADATAALIRSIRLLNNNNGREVLDLGGRAYRVTSPLPEITRSGVHIEAAGATIINEHGGDTLVLGDDSTRCEDVDIDNLSVDYPTGADAGSSAVWFRHTGDTTWKGGEFTGIARLARFGDGPRTAARATLEDVQSSLGPNGLTQDGVVWIESGRSVRLDDVHCNGTGVSSGAMVLIAPTNDAGFVDTVMIDNSSFQSWQPGSLVDGKDHGIKIDMTAGKVTNVNARTTVLDHTSDAGVFIVLTGDDDVRRLHFIDLRTDADSGSCYRLRSSGTAGLESLLIADGFGFVQSAHHAIDLEGDPAQLTGLRVHHMDLSSVGGVAKPAAIRAAGSNFTVDGNTMHRAGAFTANTGFAALVEVDAAADIFSVHGNVGRAGTDVIDNTPATANKSILGNVAA